MTTWPSSSAASSSPPDFTAHAPSRPPRKKPEPFSQPGRQPEYDQQKLRNTRGAGGGVDGDPPDADRGQRPARGGGIAGQQRSVARRRTTSHRRASAGDRPPSAATHQASDDP